MARLPRLVVPGEAHLVVLRAAARPVCVDDADRDAFVSMLFDAAAGEGVAVHAYALAPGEARMLATPAEAASLSRAVQQLGRRYVSAYNRRHGGAGTLWSGRFRCGVVEAGALRLAALLWVEGLPGALATSAPHRLGDRRDARLADPPEVWSLGNTPFEREAAYRVRLAQGPGAVLATLLQRAAQGGWAAGTTAFGARVEAAAGRPVAPRPAGRPPRRLRTTEGRRRSRTGQRSD